MSVTDFDGRVCAAGPRGDVRERWYPCIKTLPMGFSHAVPLAQRLHENFMATRVGFADEDRITADSSLHIGAARFCAYIDDLTLLGTDKDEVARHAQPLRGEGHGGGARAKGVKDCAAVHAC